MFAELKTQRKKSLEKVLTLLTCQKEVKVLRCKHVATEGVQNMSP